MLKAKGPAVVFSMAISMNDESSIQGMKEVLRDVLIRNCGFSKIEFDGKHQHQQQA